MLRVNSKKSLRKKKKELDTDHDYLKGKAKTTDAHPTIKQPIAVYQVPETLLSQSVGNSTVDTVVNETSEPMISEKTAQQLEIMNKLLTQLKTKNNVNLKNKNKLSNSNIKLQSKVQTNTVNFLNTSQYSQDEGVKDSSEPIPESTEQSKDLGTEEFSPVVDAEKKSQGIANSDSLKFR